MSDAAPTMTLPERRPLRLLAEDDDDLQVISAALQDALSTVGEIAYEPQARRLTIALNRFCWECSVDEPIRIRAGLQLGGVLGVKSRDVKLDAKDAIVSILALTFEPNGDAEDPGGAVLIHLAGDGDIRVEVECIDAVLSDLSEPWPAQASPAHQV
jgi:hypothetical protein